MNTNNGLIVVCYNTENLNEDGSIPMDNFIQWHDKFKCRYFEICVAEEHKAILRDRTILENKYKDIFDKIEKTLKNGKYRKALTQGYEHQYFHGAWFNHVTTNLRCVYQEVGFQPEIQDVYIVDEIPELMEFIQPT